MAVDEKRNRNDPPDFVVWSQCEVTWQRSHVSCAWVALMQDAEREEVMRSPVFRWHKGGNGGGPLEAPDAVSCLAALEETLVTEGWEPVDGPREAWYARSFRRPVVPLAHRIAAYGADSALIAFVAPGSGDDPTEPEPVTLEPVTPEPVTPEPVEAALAERAEAERLEAERREAERLESERLEVERLEAERLEAARLEAARLEAERLEAERLAAERLEAERLEAERLEGERLEAERMAAEAAEAERLEAERHEAELKAAEAARIEAERLEAERLEAERLEAERLAAERESPLRDLIASYTPRLDSDVDVRRHYSGPSAQLDPDKFLRKLGRRRRRR